MDINSIGANSYTTPQPTVSRTIQQMPAAAVVSQAPDEQQTEAARAAAGNAQEVVLARRYVANIDNDEQRESDREEARAEEKLAESVEDLNEFIKPYNTSLQFAIEEELGSVFVKIVDTETLEVIKQIPSEEAIALSKALSRLKGLLVKEKA
jgi:flagellar protein FlaG